MEKKNSKLPTKFSGVRYREHHDRKLKNGTLDRYYFIRYKLNGMLKEEGLGWASEGWNPEKAYRIRSELRGGQVTGNGPQTLADMRQANEVIEQEKTIEENAEKAAAMTLADFFKIHYMPRAKKEKRSWLTDEQRINKLINPALGHLPMASIKKADIQEFVDELAESGAAPSTVKQYMAIIRRAYNMATEVMVDDQPLFAGTNPTKGVKLPGVKNARDRFLTGEEAEKLISAAAKLQRSDLHDAIVLSLNTGLRLGELRRLTWLDVDFLSNILNVREEAQRKPGGKVPINEAAKTVLLSRKESSNRTDLVFPPVYGQSFRENLSHEFKRLVDRLGFNKGLAADDRQRRIVFHSLRHTFASWLAMAGVDIYRIKSLMRHKTLDMTMRYAHLIPDATHEAVHNLKPPTKG
jgi:integrase